VSTSQEVILSALDGEWRSPAEICRKVDCWTVVWIKRVLKEAARAGLVAESYVAHKSGQPMAVFRKIQQ